MQVLALLVAVGVVCSLATVLGYGALLVLGALRTLSGRAGVRSLDDELDRVLAEILGEDRDPAPHPPSSR